MRTTILSHNPSADPCQELMVRKALAFLCNRTGPSLFLKECGCLLVSCMDSSSLNNFSPTISFLGCI
uniref:Uncharacterized protein n=1 Tax=Manihot esculenta TaxID=3983 RepID=A0A2C9UFQ5_MANES